MGRAPAGSRSVFLFLAALLVSALVPGCARLQGEGTPPAGKTVSAPARFVDVAEAAGLRYAWQIPGKRPHNILQTIGNGCAFLDYNNDGNLDVLLVGPRLALFRGDGKGHFTDVTRETGLAALSGHFLGCAVGDVDGDGYDDIYISGYQTGLLLHNEQGRGFRDVTRASGLKPVPWGTSCAFAETVPGSGRLDLYVANYVDFDPNVGPLLCDEGGKMTSCGPRYYKPRTGILYRNDGRGHFTDITEVSGAAKVTGKGLGVAFADFDGSGRPGLAIANDEMPGDLLHPEGKAASPRFANIAVLSATAYDSNGNVHGGMGLDWGDYDNDGSLDLFVSTFQNEAKSLYHNEGAGQFNDQSAPTGLGPPTSPYVAFGCKFLDYDNDGWLDLVVANGHVQDNIEEIDANAAYRQPCLLFHNKGSEANEGKTGSSPPTFEDVSNSSGPDLQRKIVGRGLAVGDYDNDGKMDALVVDSEGKPLLLHNQNAKEANGGHWLGLRLRGTKSNRDGYGAILTLKIGARTLMRQCQADGSYLSSSDRRIHFGLGSATRIDSLIVRWPSGRVDAYANLPVDRYVTLTEGSATPRVLP